MEMVCRLYGNCMEVVQRSYGDNREFKISERGRGRERLETIHFNYIV